MRRSNSAIFLSGIIGTAGLVIAIRGALIEPTSFFRSYLFGYLFWIDIPLGALPLLMIYHLTGGTWGALLRRILEALCDTIIYFAVFSLPILLGVRWIYPWMDSIIAHEPNIYHKHLYLNPVSFATRTFLYFGSWLTLNFFLQKESRPYQASHFLESQARLKKISAGGLVLFGFTSTFASVDWQMSVEPHWYSTIYGLVYIAGQSLESYAFILIIFGFAFKKLRYLAQFPKKPLLDLGNILLTLVLVWAYLSFMQYLIVWSGNLPHEVIWFKHRTQGGWQGLVFLIFIFQFTAPFLFLLLRPTKEKTTLLATLGILVFLVRIIDHYWMLMPAFSSEVFKFSWETVPIWIGMGGIWLALFLRRLSSEPIFSPSEPDWPAEVHAHV
jgi:hypothetical protein